MVQSIDVRRCNAEKKYEGDLSFTVDPADYPVGIPFVSFASPVEARLRYEILEDDSVRVTGSLAFTLKGLCSRCLKETERRITGEAEGYFIPNGDGKEDYSYTNGVVKLEEFLREEMLFLMPMQFLCGDGCSAPDYQEE